MRREATFVLSIKQGNFPNADSEKELSDGVSRIFVNHSSSANLVAAAKIDLGDLESHRLFLPCLHQRLRFSKPEFDQAAV